MGEERRKRAPHTIIKKLGSGEERLNFPSFILSHIQTFLEQSKMDQTRGSILPPYTHTHTSSPVGSGHRRKISTGEKAKIVAAVWMSHYSHLAARII